MEPAVSIIIPVYNSENTLRKCIVSLAEQTFCNNQIIIINDGSTDGSLDIIKELEDRYNNIEYYNQDNQGVSSARNNGLKRASGEYLLFVDADDYLEPSYISDLYSCAKNQNADIVISSYKKQYEDGKNVLKVVDPINSSISSYTLIMELLNNRKANIEGYPWGKLFKRNITNELSFDPKISICEDLLFCIEAACNSKNIYITDSDGYNYFVNPNGALHQRYSVKTHSAIDAINKISDVLTLKYDNSIKEAVYIRLGWEILGQCSMCFKSLKVKKMREYASLLDKDLKQYDFTAFESKEKLKSIFYKLFFEIIKEK